MGAGHDHGTSALHAGANHRGRLWWAAGMLAAFMVVEAGAAPPATAIAAIRTIARVRLDTEFFLSRRKRWSITDTPDKSSQFRLHT